MTFSIPTQRNEDTFIFFFNEDTFLIHLVYLSVAVIWDLTDTPSSVQSPPKKAKGRLKSRIWAGRGPSLERPGWRWEGQGLDPSGVAAGPSQGDDEDRDVIPGTQLVVGETPATVPGGAPGP